MVSCFGSSTFEHRPCKSSHGIKVSWPWVSYIYSAPSLHPFSDGGRFKKLWGLDDVCLQKAWIYPKGLLSSYSHSSFPTTLSCASVLMLPVELTGVLFAVELQRILRIGLGRTQAQTVSQTWKIQSRKLISLYCIKNSLFKYKNTVKRNQFTGLNFPGLRNSLCLSPAQANSKYPLQLDGK